MNPRPCKECVHYDAIIVGDKRQARRGWCAVKSEYPAVEPQGRVFPVGVKRVVQGALAKPVIVIGQSVVSHCQQFRERSAP